MKKILPFILGLFFLSPLINAQTKVFSVGELDPYFGEYIKPLAIGTATALGAGWAHEARPHKTLGFDISLSATAVMFPTSALNFSTDALSEMVSNGYSFGGASTLPTIVSPDQANTDIAKTISTPLGSEELKIPAFNGLDIPFAPGASLQLAVGLPKGIEIIGRYVPEAGSYINDYAGLEDITVNKMNSWGIGVKHDIKQWIPVVSKVPLLEISALLAYSEFNFDVSSPTIAITPQTLSDASGFNIQDNSGADYTDQGFAMSMNSLNGALLVGANIPIIRPFIGVGFNKASVETGLTGTFPILHVNDSPTNLDDVFYIPSESDSEEGTEQSPLYLEAEKTFVNFQAGLNIKIAILTIHAQYTYQEYSMYSGGISIGFR